MKNILLTILSACLVCASCSEQQRQPDTSGTAASSALPVSFYKRFEGTIAGQPVVMHLQKAGSSVQGIYYYRNVGTWLSLSLDSLLVNGFVLSEYFPGDAWSDAEMQYAHLRCFLTDSILKGTWTSGDGKRSFPVELKENYPAGATRFTLHQYTDSIVAFPGKKDSPSATAEYVYVVPDQNEWLAGVTKKVLGFGPELNFEQGIKQLNEAYFKSYKENLPAADDTTEDLSSGTWQFDHSQSVSVCYNDKGFVILEEASYDYSGGAHGMYGSTLHCFDLKGTKELALSDILSADSATLQPILEKYFRIQYHIKTDSLSEVLFENYLPPNENFYFNERGLGFVYNPYEVASYAQGQINVFIPFKALTAYLKPEFSARIQP